MRALSVAECDAVMAAALPHLEPATIEVGDVLGVAPQYRDSDAWAVPPDSPMWALLAELTQGIGGPMFDAARVIRYSVDGHFAWHTDAPRVLTVILLVDPGSFEGGVLELAIPGRPRPIPLERGVPMVVPRAQHRLTPVTAGERWVAVTWTEGER